MIRNTKKLLLISLLSLSLLIAMNNAQTTSAANDGQTGDTCTSPTESITISTIDTGDDKLGYNPDTPTVGKGACVAITLTNPSDNDHDFDMDANTDVGFALVHIEFFRNSTDRVINLQFPNDDVTLEFHCAVAGHIELGMFGDIKVGSGTEAPGFEFSASIITFFALAIAIPNIRKIRINKN